MRQVFSKSLLIAFFVAYVCCPIQGKEVVKILAVGNSFSEDAVEQYLYELAAANGDSLVIGNAYIGGCSLQRHLDNVNGDREEYRYRKIIGGEKTTHPSKVSIGFCLADEDWDYITFQQASGYSGVDSTYWPLPELIAYARRHASKPDVEFLFHQTWAYAQHSTHDRFKNYGNDQQEMYRAIVKTVGKHAKKNKIKRIIPSGTAIQNGRTSFLGDHFCRDGYHLSWTLGRYTAACAWVEVFTGKSAVGNTYVPDNMTALEARVAQRAAHYAVLKPEKITSLAGYAEDYMLQLDIPYYDRQEETDAYMNEKCLLDFYYPKNKKGFTTVVWFHGGSLTGGRRYIPRLLEEKGIAVLAAGYRLSPKARHPSYIEDAAAAVGWAKRHVADYGGDPDKVIVAGHSAGGYLAAMLALDTVWLGRQGVRTEDIYMFHPLSAQCITHYTIREEKGLPKDRWWIDEYAPVFHAGNFDTPIVLTTGQRDLEMPFRYEENRLLKMNLEYFGHKAVQLYEFPGKDHGTMVNPALEILLQQLPSEN